MQRCLPNQMTKRDIQRHLMEMFVELLKNDNFVNSPAYHEILSLMEFYK